MEKDMASTQEEILKAGIELFSEKGYEQTTIRDICNRANANVAAVNYHFKGKIGLGEAVIDHLFEYAIEQQKEFLQKQRIENEKEWKKAIYNFIYEFISDRDKEEYRNYHRMQLIFREINNPSALFGKMFAKYMAPFQKQLIQYIKMGLPADATKEEVAMWFITIMSQCVMFRKKMDVQMEIETIDFSNSGNVKKVAKHIAQTVYDGLKYRV